MKAPNRPTRQLSPQSRSSKQEAETKEFAALNVGEPWPELKSEVVHWPDVNGAGVHFRSVADDTTIAKVADHSS